MNEFAEACDNFSKGGTEDGQPARKHALGYRTGKVYGHWKVVSGVELVDFRTINTGNQDQDRTLLLSAAALLICLRSLHFRSGA